MSSKKDPDNAIIMEYRVSQNRAKSDIPTRHEGRHDIITRDLAMSKYPVPRDFMVEYRASLHVLPEICFSCLSVKYIVHYFVPVLLKDLTFVKKPTWEASGLVA
jgi:hypothetical protein